MRRLEDEKMQKMRRSEDQGIRRSEVEKVRG